MNNQVRISDSVNNYSQLVPQVYLQLSAGGQYRGPWVYSRSGLHVLFAQYRNLIRGLACSVIRREYRNLIRGQACSVICRDQRVVTDQLTTSLVRADTPERVKQGNVRLTLIVLVTGTCRRMAVAVSDLDFIVFVGFLAFTNRTHTLF